MITLENADAGGGMFFRTASRASRQSLTPLTYAKATAPHREGCDSFNKKAAIGFQEWGQGRMSSFRPRWSWHGVSHHAKGESSSVLAAILLSARRRIPAALTPYKPKSNAGAICFISPEKLVWSIIFTLAFFFCRLISSPLRGEVFHGRACQIGRQRKDAR